MKTIRATQSLTEVLKRLSKAIMESPIQFMSVDELEGAMKLSEGEFLARLEKYVKDPEVDAPSGEQCRLLIAGLLAKMYAKGLYASVVQKYGIVYDTRASVKPLNPAAKKCQIVKLRRKLNPAMPSKT